MRRCIFIITEYTVGKGRTEGTFVVVKIFSSEEAEYATKTYVSDEEVKVILQTINDTPYDHK